MGWNTKNQANATQNTNVNNSQPSSAQDNTTQKRGWGKSSATSSNNTQQNNESKNYEPYLTDDTIARAKENEFVAKANPLILNKAYEVCAVLQFKGTLPTARDRQGEWYTPRVKATVEPAIGYDKETKSEVWYTHKDGTPAYGLKITIPNGNEQLHLYAKDDISNGVKLNSAVVEKWSRDSEYGTRRPHFYGTTEILNSDKLSDRIKSIFNEIVYAGFISLEEKRNNSKMYALAVSCNEKLNSMTSKVPNKENNLVNNAYAQYINDEYGEYVELRNHDDNIVVKLGETSKGDKFAKATNFDIIEEGGKYATLFLNNALDIKDNIANDEIALLIAEYKGIDLDKPYEEPSKLKSLAISYNEKLNSMTSKVTNKENQLVNDAYARYVNDEYGECIELRCHTNNVVVKLGETSKGDKYAKAINFDIIENDGSYASVFINKKGDIREYIENKEIASLIADYKGMNLEKEQTQSER